MNRSKIFLFQKKTGVWNPDENEEYEDADGNVLSKKTYQLLKMQGLA